MHKLIGRYVTIQGLIQSLLGAFIAMRQHPDVAFFKLALTLLLIIVLLFVLSIITAHARAKALAQKMQQDDEASSFPREPARFAAARTSAGARSEPPSALPDL